MTTGHGPELGEMLTGDEAHLLALLASAPSETLDHDLEQFTRTRSGRESERTDGAFAAARVREILERRRRRELELTSLYATARSLAALREVDEVLATIVRHAHELTGADITYLSVFNDTRSELTLRAVEGSISAAFRESRVPGQTGIAAKVVETRAPYWVSNYATAAELRHYDDFDSRVTGEGLVALLGVPLTAAEQIVGILYAANRAEHHFSADEVALLSAFADHAAVALDNARLYEESRSALQHLKSAYQTIEQQVALMERAALLHEAMTHVILSGDGAGQIAEVLADSLDGDVAILDRADNVIGFSRAGETGETGRSLSPSEDPATSVTPAVQASLREAIRQGRAVSSVSDDGSRHNVTAALAGEDYLGAVIHARNAELVPVEKRTLERAAQIVGLLTLQQDAVVHAEERVRGELLGDILTHSPPLSQELLARARSRGIELPRLTAVLVIDAPSVPSLHLAQHLHTVSRSSGVLAGEHRGTATVLVDSAGAQVAATEVWKQIKSSVAGPVLVCAAAAAGPDEATAAFVRARRCCKLLRSLGIDDQAATIDQFSLYAMLFDPNRATELEMFLETSLGPLIQYDEKRRGDLIGTLSAYFASSGNLAQAARALHVHINTLLKRLDRISSLLGQDWQQPDESLRLHIALRMHELAAQLDAEHQS